MANANPESMKGTIMERGLRGIFALFIACCVIAGCNHPRRQLGNIEIVGDMQLRVDFCGEAQDPRDWSKHEWEVDHILIYGDSLYWEPTASDDDDGVGWHKYRVNVRETGGHWLIRPKGFGDNAPTLKEK